MRTRAIVIKKEMAREYDQLVTCYSEDYGTLRASARSVCKPRSLQSMHLDVLNLIEFELVHGKALPIIASAQVLNQFSDIKTSLPRLASAQFFAEVLDKVSFENEKDPKLWEFLNGMLTEISTVKEKDLLKMFRDHQSKFLHTLGYADAAKHLEIPIDLFFEQTVGQNIHSLRLLYSVLK